LARYVTARADWIDRENLDPNHLSKSTVAIDGTCLTRLEAARTRQMVSSGTELEGSGPAVEQLKHVCSIQFPEIQPREDDEAGLTEPR
jgi:hypothetical protein